MPAECYRADVSAWTLGYIIGREWEPYSVVTYNALQPRKSTYGGKYITISGGNALETWLAEQCDYMVSFEMERYNAQRPIAYTNWPTLDPSDASDGDEHARGNCVTARRAASE